MHTSRPSKGVIEEILVSFLNIFGVLGFSSANFLSLHFIQTFLSLELFGLAHTKRKETDSSKKNEAIPLQRPKSWEQRISRGIRQDETPRLLELEPEPPVGNDRRFTGRRDRARPEETLPHEKKYYPTRQRFAKLNTQRENTEKEEEEEEEKTKKKKCLQGRSFSAGWEKAEARIPNRVRRRRLVQRFRPANQLPGGLFLGIFRSSDGVFTVLFLSRENIRTVLDSR